MKIKRREYKPDNEEYIKVLRKKKTTPLKTNQQLALERAQEATITNKVAKQVIIDSIKREYMRRKYGKDFEKTWQT